MPNVISKEQYGQGWGFGPSRGIPTEFLTRYCSFMPAGHILQHWKWVSFSQFHDMKISFWWAATQLSIYFELKNCEIFLSKIGPWHCFIYRNIAAAQSILKWALGQVCKQDRKIVTSAFLAESPEWAYYILSGISNENTKIFNFFFILIMNKFPLLQTF